MDANKRALKRFKRRYTSSKAKAVNLRATLQQLRDELRDLGHALAVFETRLPTRTVAGLEVLRDVMPMPDAPY
jgi:Tfp pilus assembly protein PilO